MLLETIQIVRHQYLTDLTITKVMTDDDVAYFSEIDASFMNTLAVDGCTNTKSDCSIKLAAGIEANCPIYDQCYLVSSGEKRKEELLRETTCPTEAESTGSIEMNLVTNKKRNALHLSRASTTLDNNSSAKIIIQQAAFHQSASDKKDGITLSLVNKLTIYGSGSNRPLDPSSESDCSSSCSGIEISMTGSDSCSAIEQDMSASCSSQDVQSSRRNSKLRKNLRFLEPEFSDDTSCIFSFELCSERKQDSELKNMRDLTHNDGTRESVLANIGSLKNSRSISIITGFRGRISPTATMEDHPRTSDNLIKGRNCQGESTSFRNQLENHTRRSRSSYTQTASERITLNMSDTRRSQSSSRNLNAY